MNSSGLSYTNRTRAIRALAGVCLAGGVLFGWIWAVVGDGATVLDRRAFAALATERGSFLARAAEPLATVGPLLTAALVVVVIALLARRRRWLATMGIVSGYLLVAFAAHVAKAAERRPRPAGGLIDAGGYSFPSTEAALAIGLIAMAIVATGRTKRRARRIEVIGAACLLVGVIGTLLVSIRVHYLTDVLAGWAMGAAVFAACGLAALTIQSRHGGRDEERQPSDRADACCSTATTTTLRFVGMTDPLHARSEPGPLPDWLSQATAATLSDLQRPTVVDVVLGYLPDPELKSLGTLFVLSPDGTRAGFGIETFARGARLLVQVASGVQERFFELSASFGEARPPCPGHPHPAQPAEIAGQAWWVCPRDGRPVAPIGQVTA